MKYVFLEVLRKLLWPEVVGVAAVGALVSFVTYKIYKKNYAEATSYWATRLLANILQTPFIIILELSY